MKIDLLEPHSLSFLFQKAQSKGVFSLAPSPSLCGRERERGEELSRLVSRGLSCLLCSLAWREGRGVPFLSLSLSRGGETPPLHHQRLFSKKSKLKKERKNAPLVQMRPRGQPLHRALLWRLRLRREGHARLRRRDAVDRVLDGGAGEGGKRQSFFDWWPKKTSAAVTLFTHRHLKHHLNTFDLDHQNTHKKNRCLKSSATRVRSPPRL